MARGAVTGLDVLFWSLFAPLIPQALWVRKTAARFAPAGGASTGEAGQGNTTIRLLAIGDSIVAGVGARTLDHALVVHTAASLAETTGTRVQWKASGKSGATSRDVAKRMLPGVEDESFAAIVVSAGVNDVISLNGIARWRRHIETLLQALSARWPAAVIAFSGLPPMNHFPALPQPLRAVFGMRARQFDEELRAILDNHPQAIHIPLDFETRPGRFCDDGFHPSEQGYEEFGAMAGNMIQKHAGLASSVCRHSWPALFTTLPTAAPSGPRLQCFARSRILTGQASTPAVRSVAKHCSHWAWRPLATAGWWIRRAWARHP